MGSAAAFTPLTVADMAGEWPEQIDHFSPSGLKMFSKCPEQYRRRYVLGEKIPPDASMAWGRADHTAIEANFRRKLETGADEKRADVVGIFEAELDKEIDDAGGMSAVDWGKEWKGRRKTAARDDVLRRGAELVGAYHETICPTLTPLTIEEEFSVTVTGVRVPIIGRLDLVGEQRHGFEIGTVKPRIIDRKTSAAKKTKPEPEWRVQAGIYMLHRWLPHDWHLSVKTKKPYVYVGDENLTLKPSSTLKRQITMKLRYLAQQIAYCYVAFGEDQPWDGATLHQWACGYCGYRPTCPWWVKPRKAAG